MEAILDNWWRHEFNGGKLEGEQPLTLRRKGGKGMGMKIFDVGWENSRLPSPSSYTRPF